MNSVLYLSTRKNRHHGDAMAAGFGARCVPVENAKIESGDVLHIVGGLQFGSLELMQQLVDSGKPYLFFDRAYFGGGPGTDVLRITRGAYQQSEIGQVLTPIGRAQRFGVDLKPWRQAGDHILLVPPGEAIRKLFNLGDWEAKMLAHLKAVTKRPVVVSRKGQGRAVDHFAGCHAVLTYTSNVAVEAICAGVPAFVSKRSAAAPMAGWLGDLSGLNTRLESPPMPLRGTWAESLAWGQFTQDEILAGVARDALFKEPRALAA